MIKTHYIIISNNMFSNMFNKAVMSSFLWFLQFINYYSPWDITVQQQQSEN